LLDCGDKSGATAIFDAISSEQFALYASGETTREVRTVDRRGKMSPWYAACACRGLIEVGGDEKRKGLKRLIDLMAFLKRSEDVNDQNTVHGVRSMLTEISGKYFTTPEEASEWMTQDQSRMRTEPIAPADVDKSRR
jgi:hypothetical protein